MFFFPFPFLPKVLPWLLPEWLPDRYVTAHEIKIQRLNRWKKNRHQIRQRLSFFGGVFRTWASRRFRRSCLSFRDAASVGGRGFLFLDAQRVGTAWLSLFLLHEFGFEFVRRCGFMGGGGCYWLCLFRICRGCALDEMDRRAWGEPRVGRIQFLELLSWNVELFLLQLQRSTQSAIRWRSFSKYQMNNMACLFTLQLGCRSFFLQN